MAGLISYDTLITYETKAVSDIFAVLYCTPYKPGREKFLRDCDVELHLSNRKHSRPNNLQNS